MKNVRKIHETEPQEVPLADDCPPRNEALAGARALPSAPVNVDTIHNTLRHEIIVLRLMPGTRMSENQLAQRFGISRTPVREALFRLIGEGLIEVSPQRGTFVTRISLKSVRRARFVREAMEVAIAREAAQRGLAPGALSMLADIIAEQETSRDDPERFTRADDAFHRSLAEGIDVGDIWNVVEREKAQFDRLRFLSLPDVTPVSTLIAQHRNILDAVRAGDVASAEQATREHLSEVLKVLSRLAETHPGLIVSDV